MAESAVRSVIIVVALELTQCGCGMSLVDEQEPVEEFAADRPDEALGDRVGPRCAHWCADDLDIDGGEHGVAVADQEPKVATGVVEIHEQVAGLLGEPGIGRVCGDAQYVHPAGGVLDDEERVEPMQSDRVEMKQVAGEDGLRLCPEELRPGRSGSAGCGVDPAALRIFQTVEAPIW